ncbi:MAG: glycosyltransferase [Bacteroidales bacterium]
MIKTVAFIHHKYPYGGGERVTSQIASYLHGKGYKVFVFVRERGIDDMLPSDNEAIEFLDLPNKININAPENKYFVLDCVTKMSIDLFVDPSIDVNFLNEIKQKGHCKVIYMLHNRPLWEALTRTIESRAKVKRSFIKFLEWWILRYPKYKLFKSPEKRFIKKYKRIYSEVDLYGVLCKSDAHTIASIIQEDLVGSKIRVLTNPAYVEEEPNIQKRKQLIYVGRLDEVQKRVDRLIDIWGALYREFPDWELLIVGDGPGRSSLEAMVDKNAIERVEFLGYKKRVVPYLQDASIICMTSNFEGWPLALVEAQSYGVIPISYNCADGVKEIIGDHDEYGVLVSAFDKREYITKLRSLMKDDLRREELSRRVLVKSKDYAIEVVGKQWIEMLKSLE